MSATRPTLDELQSRDDFQYRHIGPDAAQTQAMLASLGLESLQELTEKVLPDCIISSTGVDLQAPATESEVLTELRQIADQNTLVKSLIGCGYYGTFLPPVIQRNVVENPGWYTAYTPYQPEISQGRLEALLTFQQMIMDMTGMEIANASLLDEATAAAEAMTMAKRLSRSKSNRFLVAKDCLPQTLAVVQTRARYLGIAVEVFDPQQIPTVMDCFGLLLQYPGAMGVVRDLTEIITVVHQQKGLAIVAADLLALALLQPPSEFDADIVVGSNQRFGVPLGFGGPHAGYMATRDAYKRQCPGRFIGVSIDSEGNPAMRLALQTREQHIRRDKATSNICTAQVLLANISAFYAIYHGPEGVRRIAQRVQRLTCILANGLQQMGVLVLHQQFFDTLLLEVPGRAGALLGAAVRAGYNLRLCDADHLAVALDETVTAEDVDRLLQVLGGDQHTTALTAATLDTSSHSAIPEALRRQTNYLQHPVFNSYHSETNMMRYLRRLQEKDIALNRSMTPLGSCTMKLNAVTEMMPVTWPEFSDLHPFAPPSQTAGYQHLFTDIEQMLCALTGFSAVSLQQNAGSQGEYSGLLCIRRYHETRGQSQRNVCLIPSSAHGTNPASAALAGFKVVIIQSDHAGNIDIDDLRAKAAQHADTLAAFMITYPSTHGVFEAAIHTYCDIIHEQGGQVYFDGANLNAQLGLTKPAELGADVCHMNLHKTFCIPHGGGGPGLGPIGVKPHLAPFLPDHPVVTDVNPVADPDGTIGTIAAAPWSSASILPITWAYIRLMGAAGLRRASQMAILNANYIAHRLRPYFPLVYSGQNDTVAHECIIDVRPTKEETGVSVEDIAKRLMDFGFHAPTMSFPVHDTFMIEPTESEDQDELDRFCDAMITIWEEIQAIKNGVIAHKDSPLHHAPHTQLAVLAENWERTYSRQQACFPVTSLRRNKYWPPVSRIDNVYGDRHLFCGCPDPTHFLEKPGH